MGDLYTIEQTAFEGRRLVAKQQFKAGQIIFVEQPLLRVHVPPDQSFPSVETLVSVLSQLSPEQRQLFEKLANSFQAKSVLEPRVGDLLEGHWDEREVVSAYGKLVTNRTRFGEGGAMSIWPTLSRMNFSCSPNATHTVTSGGMQITVRAIKDVKPGEPLTLSQLDQFSPAEQRQRLYRQFYNFTCRCEVCSLPKDKLARSDANRAKIAEFTKLYESWMKGPAAGPTGVQVVEHGLQCLEPGGLLDQEGIGEGEPRRSQMWSCLVHVASSHALREDASRFALEAAKCAAAEGGTIGNLAYIHFSEIAMDPTGGPAWATRAFEGHDVPKADGSKRKKKKKRKGKQDAVDPVQKPTEQKNATSDGEETETAQTPRPGTLTPRAGSQRQSCTFIIITGNDELRLLQAVESATDDDVKTCKLVVVDDEAPEQQNADVNEGQIELEGQTESEADERRDKTVFIAPGSTDERVTALELADSPIEEVKPHASGQNGHRESSWKQQQQVGHGMGELAIHCPQPVKTAFLPVSLPPSPPDSPPQARQTTFLGRIQSAPSLAGASRNPIELSWRNEPEVKVRVDETETLVSQKISRGFEADQPSPRPELGAIEALILPKLEPDDRKIMSDNLAKVVSYPVSVWYTDSTRMIRTSTQYDASHTRLFTASTVPSFCASYKSLAMHLTRRTSGTRATPARARLVAESLKPGTSLSLFVSDAEPTWESPWNTRGGRIMYVPGRRGTGNIVGGGGPAAFASDFERLLWLLVGDTFDDRVQACMKARSGVPELDQQKGTVVGVIANRKKEGDRIEVWLAGPTEGSKPARQWVNAVRNAISQDTGEALDNLKYRPHKSG